jgi:hypothetical protein
LRAGAHPLQSEGAMGYSVSGMGMNLLKGMAGAAFLCGFTATALFGHAAEVRLLGAAVGVGAALWAWSQGSLGPNSDF